MDDGFIRSYIGELLRSLRTQYLIDLIKPYTRLELSFLAQQLNVDKDEVEELLIGLILDGKVEGRIDQVTMRLELDKQFVLVCDLFVFFLQTFCVGRASKREGMRRLNVGQKPLRLFIVQLLGRILPARKATQALRWGWGWWIHTGALGHRLRSSFGQLYYTDLNESENYIINVATREPVHGFQSVYAVNISDGRWCELIK